MNLQQLKYVVEVEKTRSITAAAKNLYMGQPNLSKSLRELENELGITLFERTSRGVVFTKKGMDFLWYAKSILSQVEKVEKLYTSRGDETLSLGISVPRATYIACAFSRFTALLAERRNDLNLRYRETNAISVISDVSGGSSDLGVVRYEISHEPYFLNLLRENRLEYELLWQYPMLVMMDESHPLASCREIPYHSLSEYIELQHGDLYIPVLPPENAGISHDRETGRKILLYDRASQFDILRQVRGSYIWVSPVPPSELERRRLVTRPCTHAGVYKDLLIFRSKADITELEQRLISQLREQIAALEAAEEARKTPLAPPLSSAASI